MGEPFLRFDFVFGVAVGDGVGEVFLCLGEAVGDGLGVAFFAERFLCLRVGAGVGVAKIFLIFVPNDSSAACAAGTVPSKIATSKRHRTTILQAIGLVGRLTRSLPLSRSNEPPVHVARVPAAPFCETPIAAASDTDALQFTVACLTFLGVRSIAEDNYYASS